MSQNTSHARKPGDGLTSLHWIPPGTRRRLERDDDYAPVFSEAAE